MIDLDGGLILLYKGIEQIGRGGIVEVYKAKDTKPNHFAALKSFTSRAWL